MVTPSDTPPLTTLSKASSIDRKAARGRVRATRACDRCKAKKARCTGTQPCAFCARLSLVCLYNASYRRGRTPYILPASHVPSTVDPNVTPGTASPTQDPKQPKTSDLTDITPEQNHLTLTQTTQQDSYIGPASGVSFLARAKKRLQEDATGLSITDASIFASGDAPLPECDSSFLVLPDKQEASALLDTYFNFSSPTHRCLHKPTVVTWCNELYESRTKPQRLPGEREKNTIVMLVMALALLTTSGSDTGTDKSAMFYAAAQHQLTQENGPTRLTTVMARFLQCQYLASRSRINHAWELFGTIARLAFAIGLHRKQKAPHGRINHIEVQCRRRTFWALYSFDRYLSAALGRPKAIHDDDVDQDLPDCLNDDDILADRVLHTSSHSQSVLQASICHIKLTRILSGILREQYGITPLPISSQAPITVRYDVALQDWHMESSAFVTKSWHDILFLASPFSRQCEVLIYAYSHAVILLHRPLLLCDVKTIEDGIATQRSANACVDASVRILETFAVSCESGRIYSAFWLVQYYVFCAISILYVCIIRRLSAHDCWKQQMDLTHRCQKLLSKHALQASFAKRYAIFLAELRLEAERKLTSRVDDHSHERASLLQGSQTMEAQQDHDGFGTPIDMEEVDPIAMSSLFDELTNWEELDSFVMAGINFDFDAAFASATASGSLE